MRELSLAEKIANRTTDFKGTYQNKIFDTQADKIIDLIKDRRINGDKAGDWTHNLSLEVIQELLIISKVLCIKLNESDLTYEDQPERLSDGEGTDFRSGTLPTKFKLLTELWDYTGFIVSSYDNQTTQLKEFRDKIRLLNIIKWWAAKNYHSKKQRVLTALKKDPALFGNYNIYLISTLEAYSFNQLKEVKQALTTEFLSTYKTPTKQLIKKISNFQ